MFSFPSLRVREQQKLSMQYISPAMMTKQAQSLNQELVILLKESEKF